MYMFLWYVNSNTRSLVVKANTQSPSSDIITSLCGYSSGTKSVCLRKRWRKCYMRCIVKFFFNIYWMNINRYYVHCWVSNWDNTYRKNTLNCAIINPFCDISKFGWYWNKLKYSKEMNVCNYESFWIITWNFSMHYWFAKSSRYI